MTRIELMAKAAHEYRFPGSKSWDTAPFMRHSQKLCVAEMLAALVALADYEERRLHPTNPDQESIEFIGELRAVIAEHNAKEPT